MSIANYILAGYPLLWVESYEEYRAIAMYVAEIKNRSKEEYTFFSWDRIDGIRPMDITEGILALGDPIEGEGLNDPIGALQWIESQNQDNMILFLKDYHHYVGKDGKEAHAVSRKIRNLISEFKARSKVLVIISPKVDIPIEIEKEITVVPFKLPTRNELKIVLKGLCESTGAQYPKDDEAVLDASLGMTAFEAENAFSVSLIESKKFDASVIRREKSAIVRKTGLLEVIDTDVSLDDIGALENLKDWLNARQNCFGDDARKYGVEPPKGALLIGVPGCGKSLTSKAVGTAWGRPVLRFDLGRVMGSYVGESEANLRRSLAIAEAVAPDIIWIDELEKAFAGTGSGDSDGHGTTKRVFQEFLTWFQERKSDVFVVATANGVQALPPELLNRFEATFWVDLPDAVQRKEILGIHLSKRNRNIDDFEDEMEQILAVSEGFNGREIEIWVKEAITYAFSNGHKNVTAEALLETAKSITPIAKLDKQKIEDSRKWAADRGTKNASIVHPKEQVISKNKPRKIQTN